MFLLCGGVFISPFTLYSPCLVPSLVTLLFLSPSMSFVSSPYSSFPARALARCVTRPGSSYCSANPVPPRGGFAVRYSDSGNTMLCFVAILVCCCAPGCLVNSSHVTDRHSCRNAHRALWLVARHLSYCVLWISSDLGFTALTPTTLPQLNPFPCNRISEYLRLILPTPLIGVSFFLACIVLVLLPAEFTYFPSCGMVVTVHIRLLFASRLAPCVFTPRSIELAFIASRSSVMLYAPIDGGRGRSCIPAVHRSCVSPGRLS